MGTELLPCNWASCVAKTDDELRAFINSEDEPGWVCDSVEAQIALNKVTREIRERIAARGAFSLGL